MLEKYKPRQVLLSITGLTGTDDDGENVELITAAKYSYCNKKASVEYMESELTGMSGTMTHIFVEPDEVLVTRTGTVNMHMRFRRGGKHYFSYETPFGSMTMGLSTQSIKNDLDEQGGRLEVNYLMDMDSTMPTRNKFIIQIKS